jgi:hypothetical protein
MKCPHCGMNIRDNITECGYCGGKIAQRPDKMPAGGQKAALSTNLPQKGASPPRKSADEPDGDGDEEEEGGLSRILQQGEQVLIGALNVSVKKFFFHAYLTNQRIFLIDTQEKKLKVTAKDVPRNTIAGSIIEYSENSDPVLVISIRSADDDIKTMKLVFAQNGMDRSAEIDEWVALLSEDRPAKKPKRPPVEEVVRPEEEPEQEPEPPRPAKPVQKPPQELRPARKPTKDLEKQPPVKRLLSMYKMPEEEPAPLPEPEPEVITPPPRRAQIRQVPEPVKRPVVTPVYDEGIPEEPEVETPPVRKPEVQSAMKVAMKSAMRPLQQQHQMPVRRTIAAEPEQEPPAPPRRPVVHEPPREKPVVEEDLPAATPQFCHNCGKKLPHSANFCPGCGTKLSQSRTLPQARHSATIPDKRATRTDPPAHEHKSPHIEEYDEDEGGETPVPAKPPIKKAPKGSEMTILHKFLRR